MQMQLTVLDVVEHVKNMLEFTEAIHSSARSEEVAGAAVLLGWDWGAVLGVREVISYGCHKFLLVANIDQPLVDMVVSPASLEHQPSAAFNPSR